MRSLRHLILLCSSIYPLTGCLNIAEDRAVAELKVGDASLPELEVKVRSGSAAVRSFILRDGVVELWLWAQTPTLSFSISRRDHSPLRELKLKVSNVMDQSALTTLAPVPLSTMSPEEDAPQSPTANQRALEDMNPHPTLFSASLSLEALGESLLFTLTPPEPPLGERWRFALFADVQEQLDRFSQLLTPLRDEQVRFVLVSGDLTSQGTSRDLLTFQDQLEERLGFPCYATLGNHELGTPGVPFHQIFGRGSYSFAYGGARFSLLDGASATLAPSTRRALSGWLDAGQEQLHVITTHIPLLDPDGTRGGAFASKLEAIEILSELSAHQVDLLLYGHVHTYRAFNQASIPTIISGGGGSIPMRFDGVGRHYVVFEVDQAQSHISHRLQRIYPEE